MEWNGNYSDAFDYTEMCTPATSLTLPHGFRELTRVLKPMIFIIYL